MTDLRRHVPPLTLTWDDEAPGARWRVVDGTLVFADVSGFTALTEKLTQRGRIGAEEIVETLNRVFGPMLRIAAARGGELLKFGGDALLFLFRGPDHPEQACDAAVEMRTALRQAAAEPTSVGRLSLSMSVGVHSGDIHLFLVGSPTRELLVLGPGATATALAEKAAEAGQVVVSRATVPRLDRAATRPREDGEPMLRRRGPHREAPGAPPLQVVTPELMRTLFPHRLGEYLAPGPPDPEHRLACIAFIRVSGTDEVLARRGPDALAEALDATLGVVEAALEPEAVTLLATDIDIDGAKLFLGAGIPTAFEDNEGRMLRALRRIADARAQLPLQIGVNRGHVFAAEVGIDERAAYTGMGDTTNTAARIAAKAVVGALYAHPSVLEHSRTRFAAAPAGRFPMKGKAVPLLVYEVSEELGTREEAVGDARLPLVGRDAELATVTDALGAALDGAGGVLSVVGAAGLGKTRLVREALERVPSDHLLVLRCEPYGSGSAYRALRDPVRSLLGIERDTPETMGRALLDALARIAPELLPMAPLLADAAQVDVPSTPEADRLTVENRPDRLADAVETLVAKALPGRLAVVAEDAHWMDASSAHVLDRLALTSPGRPWAVVVIRRPEPGGAVPEVDTEVRVLPLPAEDVERLVIAATESTPLRPHEIAAVVDRAEGSPLFVEEVTRAAVQAGSLEELPESVGEALSAQIDALPTHARRVLRYCAVLGRSFRLELLAEVLGTDGHFLAPSDLGGLAAFLEADGPLRMRFRNSLVRDAAYEGLAYRLRAQLHRTAGETLERLSTDRDADAPMLALHFWRAADSQRTWEYANRAGVEARRAYANVDAAEMYERALEASRRVPGVTDVERSQLWSLVGELRELAGMLDASVEAYRRAAELAKDPVTRAEAMARRARVHSRAGHPDTGVRVIGAARRLLQGHDGDDRTARVEARLDHLMAIARLNEERPREGRQWAEQAVRSAREIEDWDTLMRALLALDYAEQQLGQSGIGEHTREALDIAIRVQDRPQESIARANLGVLAFYAGRWDEAIEWLTSSSSVAVAAGNDFGAAETDLTYAEILIHQGHLDEADEVLRRAFRVLKASGIDAYAAHALMLQARISLARGDCDEARERATSAVDQYREMGSAVDGLEASAVLAEVEIRAGYPGLALSIVDQAWHAAHGEADALLARVEAVRGAALLALDRADDTRDAIDRGLAAAREQALPYDEAQLLRLRSTWFARRGLDDDGSRAQNDAAAADRILVALGDRR